MSETIATIFNRKSNYADNVVGLELELEQVCATESDEIFGLLNITEDHSLRNNGLEFISVPLPVEGALRFCKDVLYSKGVSYHDVKERCTERGSIHVHVNMQHMTGKQVQTFLRYYCLLEPQFFAEVAEHRRNNIYCVPLMATAMPRYIQQKTIQSCVGLWHKYTALNAKPLKEYGTVEFRHLQATDDLELIERWLNIIMRLKDEAANARHENFSWQQVLDLHQRVFGKPATKLEEMEICFQEDLVSSCYMDSNTITMRVKLAKAMAKGTEQCVI